MTALPWSQSTTGLRLMVRLTPRGGRNALGGIRKDEAGRAQLLARVSSPPVEGAANAALIKLVAKTLGLPKSAVTLAASETARVKTPEISGDPEALEQALKRLI